MSKKLLVIVLTFLVIGIVIFLLWSKDNSLSSNNLDTSNNEYLQKAKKIASEENAKIVAGKQFNTGKKDLACAVVACYDEDKKPMLIFTVNNDGIYFIGYGSDNDTLVFDTKSKEDVLEVFSDLTAKVKLYDGSKERHYTSKVVMQMKEKGAHFIVSDE